MARLPKGWVRLDLLEKEVKREERRQAVVLFGVIIPVVSVLAGAIAYGTMALLSRLAGP